MAAYGPMLNLSSFTSIVSVLSCPSPHTYIAVPAPIHCLVPGHLQPSQSRSISASTSISPTTIMDHVSRKQLELYANLKSRGTQLQSDKNLLTEVSELLKRVQQLQLESPYSEDPAPPLADSPASAPPASEASSTTTTVSAAARALAYHVADDRAEDMSSAAGELFTIAFSIAMNSVEEQKDHMEQNDDSTTSSKKRESFFRRTGRNLRNAQADVHNKCMDLAEMSEEGGGGLEGDVAVARQVVDVLGELVKMVDGRREALEALSKLDEI